MAAIPKDETYYKEDKNNCMMSPCENDLLEGKIHIYEVPFEYRTPHAYIYACRAARARRDDLAGTEKKLSEFQLLSDIIEHAQNNHQKAYELRELHSTYFISEAIGRERLL